MDLPRVDLMFLVGLAADDICHPPKQRLRQPKRGRLKSNSTRVSDVGELVRRHQPRPKRRVRFLRQRVRLHQIGDEDNGRLRQGPETVVELGRFVSDATGQKFALHSGEPGPQVRLPEQWQLHLPVDRLLFSFSSSGICYCMFYVQVAICGDMHTRQL
jgi:hypothetical protein